MPDAPNPSPVDALDYSALLPEDPDGKAQAYARALRGEQLETQRQLRLGGDATQLPALQEGQEKAGTDVMAGFDTRGVQRLREQREIKALDNSIAYRQYEMARENREHKESEGHKAVAEDREAAGQAHGFSQDLDAQVVKYGTDVEHHAQFFKVLNETKALTAAHPDWPGIGTFAGKLPAPLTSGPGMDLREHVNMLKVQFDNATGGVKSMNPGMLAEYGKATSLMQ